MENSLVSHAFQYQIISQREQFTWNFTKFKQFNEIQFKKKSFLTNFKWKVAGNFHNSFNLIKNRSISLYKFQSSRNFTS